MTREEAIKIIRKMLACTDLTVRANLNADMVSACNLAIKALEQEPTTKNDLAQERYQDLIEYFGDEKVAKTILESRKEFKAWLERLRWNVKRTDELARELEQIKGTTKNDLGVDSTPNTISFKEMMDNLKITAEDIENAEDLEYSIEPLIRPKNDLVVDCVSRKAVINQIFYSTDNNGDVVLGSALRERIEKLPSITPTSRESVDCIDRQATLDAIIKRLGIKNETYLLEAERVIYQQILAMPSVTPQLSSELEKNSKKLEKDFGESDCISRQAVLDLIADYDLSMGQVVRGIHALPSVTSQPRKGHWEHGKELSREYLGKTLIDITYEDWHCSNCHCVIEQSIKPKWSYCPSCGADMREVEDG